MSPDSPTLTFHTLSGPLIVQKNNSNNSLQMNFPQGNPVPVILSQQTINDIRFHLAFPSEAIIEQVYHCAKTRKLLIEVKDPASILALQINSESLMKVSFPSNLEVKGIIVTAQSSSSPTFSQYDFISRYFAPWNGINEDPVTGSAHTVLAVYWCQKLKKTKLQAFQASARGGALGVELNQERVILDGTAVIVVRGTISLTSS